MNPRPPQQEPDEDARSTQLQDTRGGQVEDDRGSDYLITVQIEPQYEDKLDSDRLHRLAIEVLKAENVPGPLELGVVVTTDAEVRTLNRDYLGHDYDTDVISFGMGEEEDAIGGPGFVTPPERPAYLGDIAISYDRAVEQAPEYGHPVADEVAMLLIHGILHLVGYDDLEDAARDKMHSRQQELLESLYRGK
jgi:probable rRNA maturation factor